MKKYFLTLLSLIILGCHEKAVEREKKENSNALEYLKNEMKKQRIPATQIVVIKDNEVVLSKTLGFANVPFSVNANDSTLFSISSIGKIFTSTAIMQLVEKNKIKLSDKISKHLKNLPNTWNSVTVENLLSHTSGLPSIEDPITGELIGNRGIKEAWELVIKLPIQFEPKDQFDYNATNYLLLYKLIEKCSGMPYQSFVRKNQFEVAGMQRIHFQNSSDVFKNKSPTYSFYHQNKSTGEYEEKENLTELNDYFPIELTTDSGAYTTANEMAKWILALLNNKLLSKKESITTMWKPIKLNNGTYDGIGDNLNAYALGWPILKRDKHSAVVPFGGGRACIFIYPKENLSIILNTNLMGCYPNRIIDSVAKFYLK